MSDLPSPSDADTDAAETRRQEYQKREKEKSFSANRAAKLFLIVIGVSILIGLPMLLLKMDAREREQKEKNRLRQEQQRQQWDAMLNNSRPAEHGEAMRMLFGLEPVQPQPPADPLEDGSVNNASIEAANDVPRGASRLDEPVKIPQHSVLLDE